MKWRSYLILAGFLISGNFLAQANVDRSAIQQYTQPPAEVNQLLSRLKPEQLARLPGPARDEATRRLTALQDEARQELASRNPIANGQIPTSLPTSTPTALSSAITSTASPTDSGQRPGNSTTPAATPPTSQLGNIDPLGAIATAIGGIGTTNTGNDIANLTTGNAREITAFREYYENTYDKVDLLNTAYTQLKSVLSLYESKLDDMLNKLPATVNSCTRVP